MNTVDQHRIIDVSRPIDNTQRRNFAPCPPPIEIRKLIVADRTVRGYLLEGGGLLL